MRFGSVGLGELLLLVLLVVFIWRGRALPSLGRRLGEQARKPFRKARWLWGTVAGSEEEALRAEEAFGRECAREFGAQFPAAVSSADQSRVAELGARMSAALGESPRVFAFRAVAAPVPNAFALPGGFVFVTDGLLRLCGDDREALAFVVAHEIGHVLKRHTRDRLMADMVVGVVGRRLPAAGRVAREMMQKAYSREQELEADACGVRLLQAAGLDPSGGVRALELLARQGSQPEGAAEYFSTHPKLEDRVKALRVLIEEPVARGAAP